MERVFGTLAPIHSFFSRFSHRPRWHFANGVDIVIALSGYQETRSQLTFEIEDIEGEIMNVDEAGRRSR